MNQQSVLLVIGIALIPFGGFRIYLSTQRASKQRRHHLIAGIAFCLSGLFLIARSRGWLSF